VQRLKTRTQFQAVLAGSTVARTTHFVLHRTPLDVAAPAAMQQQPLFSVKEAWLGAMVPKRWAKRAVTRNAIKRQIYAEGSTFESTLKPMAHVIRLRSAFDKTVFVSATSDAFKQAVRTELNQLFCRANGL
jgi:ribonuclease P protein component